MECILTEGARTREGLLISLGVNGKRRRTTHRERERGEETEGRRDPEGRENELTLAAMILLSFRLVRNFVIDAKLNDHLATGFGCDVVSQRSVDPNLASTTDV